MGNRPPPHLRRRNDLIQLKEEHREIQRLRFDDLGAAFRERDVSNDLKPSVKVPEAPQRGTTVS